MIIILNLIDFFLVKNNCLRGCKVGAELDLTTRWMHVNDFTFPLLILLMMYISEAQTLQVDELYK